MFEPEYSDGEERSDSEDSDIDGNHESGRVGNTLWCECEECISLSERECVCCQEWEQLYEKLEAGLVDCITEHNLFDTICLNQHV